MNEILDSAGRLAKEGFSYIPGSSLSRVLAARKNGSRTGVDTAASVDAGATELSGETEPVDLGRFGSFFENLREDPFSPGRRFRSYAQCHKAESGRLEYGHFEQYMQTPEYNPDTGGIVRSYPLIDDKLTSDAYFNALVEADADIVAAYGLVGDPWDLSVGIHLFRYWATPDQPAYSSPVWLHRDDEDVVFLHLVHKSANLIGGDNIIAVNARTIERVLSLREPGDTLIVDHQKFHAVTPIGCAPPSSEGEEVNSFRDIILVTFQKRKVS